MRSTPQTWSLSHVGAYRGWPSSQLFAGACNVAVFSTNRQETGESDRGRLPLSVCAACSCQCPLWLVAAASRRRVQLWVLYISTPVLDSPHTHRQTHQSRPQPPSTMSRLPRQQWENEMCWVLEGRMYQLVSNAIRYLNRKPFRTYFRLAALHSSLLGKNQE